MSGAAPIGDFPARTWSPKLGRAKLPAPPRSRQRLAIEEVLRHTSRSTPLTVDELAQRTGHARAAIRSALNGLVQRGHVENATPHQLPARYRWSRKRGWTAPEASTDPRVRFPDGLYDGRELHPYCGRPGAMDAFALPSLVDGVRVPRRAPMLVGESLEPKR